MRKKFIEYKALNEEISMINKALKVLSGDIYKLKEELVKYIIDNKLYIPIEELSKYNDKDLDSIDLVLETGEIKHFWKDELMGVKDNHFYYSSYEGGIYEFNEETGTYKSYYHFSENKGDKVIGYMNLKTDVWDEPVEEEGKMMDILEKAFKEGI